MTNVTDTGEGTLEVAHVEAGYSAGSLILRGVSVSVERGEIVTIIGSNGAGKSTLLKVIFGLLSASRGEVRLRGERIDGMKPHELVERRLAYVPQVENVFPSLTVRENLEMSGRGLGRSARRQRIAAMLEMFPDLGSARERAAGVLSGGQRQMLAMARALMPEPTIILLDEPSAGLAPRNVEQVFAKVIEIAGDGVGVMIVEQNARQALSISRRGYVLDMGTCRYEGSGADVLGNPEVVEMYLGKA